jgi:16S rRNA (adenine1518-N6/adenine1519-N6)-dimethyltransferase
MSIFKPSELHQFLIDLGAKPKKVLSQNFLIDGNILKKIVAAAEIQPGDLVLEIGPGPGALTDQLLAAGARVVAVEKDDRLAGALPRLDREGRLEVFAQDINDFPIADELKKRLAPGQKAKVVANLPYHLTSKILADLVPMHDVLSDVVVMVQDEAARRFAASAGNKEYGSFTVFLNFYSKVKYCFKVKNTCFFPPPKVESAIVALKLREPPVVDDLETFFRFTRGSFEHRRKMMRGTWRDELGSDRVERALEEVGAKRESRPEQLSLEQFLALYAILFMSTT